MSSQSQIVELNDHQFIKVSGSDFRKFLQGQLSCNMDNLSPQRSLRGAICNLKGRVVADLRVVQKDDGCLLQAGPGMAQIVVDTLAKYAVFFKVKLAADLQQPAPFGVIGNLPDQMRQLLELIPDAPDAVSQNTDFSVIRLAGRLLRYEIWPHHRRAADALAAAIKGTVQTSNRAWRRADIESGVVHVDRTLTEEYTPQLLNYDISGVIDFKKGCYTGQEVVARMFYRGVAKQRLYLASTNAKLTANDTVLEAAGTENKSSAILAFSNGMEGSADRSLLLASLGTEAVASGAAFTLSEQPQSTLTIHPLEYEN